MPEQDNKELIPQLKQDIARWKGRAIEAAEMACMHCRQTDPELCRFCRMQKIRDDAGR